jgi:hypothetical protein
VQGGGPELPIGALRVKQEEAQTAGYRRTGKEPLERGRKWQRK